MSSKKQMRKRYNKPKNKTKKLRRKLRPWSMLNVLKKSKWACHKKRKFPNRSTANELALQYGQYVYHCPGCGKYHLSTSKA